jgi:hypothetical protein
MLVPPKDGKPVASEVEQNCVRYHGGVGEIRSFLEAINMMAMDLESTPPGDATPALRTISQAAIDKCEELLEIRAA